MGVTHLVFDTETLGLTERAVVTTLSCVPFQFENPKPFKELVRDGFYVKFNVAEQIKTYKRITDQSTLDWWKGQSKAAKEQSILPSKHDKSLVEGLEALNDFIKNHTSYDWRESFVWSRGNYFDFPKIESLYADAGLKLAFNTWKIRDTRTMIDVMTGSDNGMYDLQEGIPDEFVKHNSLHDSAIDCLKMTEIFQRAMTNE